MSELLPALSLLVPQQCRRCSSGRTSLRYLKPCKSLLDTGLGCGGNMVAVHPKHCTAPKHSEDEQLLICQSKYSSPSKNRADHYWAACLCAERDLTR